MTGRPTEVALHCVICFEEFDSREHIPVVLPCGHTYVCCVCARRLRRCMECREPLFWVPPPHASGGTAAGQAALLAGTAGRSPGPSRGYSASRSTRLGPGRYSPGTPVAPPPGQSQNPGGAPGGGTGPQKPEEVPLPCPKNLVLMEMIEAKERQARLMAEAKRKREVEKREQRLQQRKQRQQQDLTSQYAQHNLIDNTDEADDDEEEEDDDDDDDEQLLDPALSGMEAFSGACGTYVVREPLGLVVLPQDPNRQHHHRALYGADGGRDSNNANIGNQKYDLKARLRHHEEEDHLSSSARKPTTGGGSGAASRGIEGDGLDDEKKEQAEDSLLILEAMLQGDSPPDLRGDPSRQHRHHLFREPFTIEEGQRVQVVGMVDEGVYQLARRAGYVVATVNQLVKVGGPMETSCKMEGMLQSVERKQREVQRQLDQIVTLAQGLHEKIALEQSQPEGFPVIERLKNSRNDPSLQQGHADENDTTANASRPQHQKQDPPELPTTPTKIFNVNSHSPSSNPNNSGVELTHSTDSTTVELGAPRTPGPPPGSHLQGGGILEMEGVSGSQGSGGLHQYEQYLNSPAHSCPMPIAAAVGLERPYMDGTPTGLPRYRVNSDDDLYGLGWAGALGCGSTLFGERLLESSGHGTGNILSASGNDILALSFDENALLDHAHTRRRAAALAAAAGATTVAVVGGGSGGGSGSVDSPLRSGGSFDGVNFRTGMSGHRGLTQTKRDRNSSGPRRQIRMMSEHRGVAAPAGPGGAPALKRRSTPGESFVGGCHEY